MPPTKTIEDWPDRIPLESRRADLAVQIPMPAKAAFGFVRGAILGIITASGLLRQRARSTAAGTGFTDNSPTGQVANGEGGRFVAADVLKNETGETIGTVQSVDTTTNPDTITLTGNAQVNVAVGEAVMASDGSEVARLIANEEVKATETENSNLSPYAGGYLKKDQLVGLDDSAIAELNGRVVANDFIF